MSSFMNQARARALRTTIPRPRLTIVPRVAARAPRVPFVMLVVTVLLAGLIGLLLLNTSLQSGAYAVTDLRTQADRLAIKQQQLEMQVAGLQQPQRVAERAVALGMVQNDSPAFLSLRNGKVIGKAVPGVPGDHVDIGRQPKARPDGDRKTDPVTGGEHISGTTGVTERRPERRGGPDQATPPAGESPAGRAPSETGPSSPRADDTEPGNTGPRNTGPGTSGPSDRRNSPDDTPDASPRERGPRDTNNNSNTNAQQTQ